MEIRPGPMIESCTRSSNENILHNKVGISRYYTLDEDDYPEFLGDNDEGMDLLGFIRSANPTKVRVAERQRAEDEPRVLEFTVGRVVPLLSIAPARASSELEASIDRLFDEGASEDGQDADVQPVTVTTDTIVEDVAPLQPRHQRKRKTVVVDAGGPSHPPKKLREDFGALGGVSTAGKSMAVVQSLFSRAMLEAEARGEPIPTFPFVTSSVSATPKRKDRSSADSVHGPNLRTIGAPQRFVISSDSSHHFGANIAKAEVDSIIRSSASAIATVTIVTAAIDTEATTTRAPVAPSLFGVGSSSTGGTDSVLGGFSDVSGSDFLIGGIRTVVDPDSNCKKFTSRDGVRLMDLGLTTAVSVVRCRAAENKDGEIESLKAQLLLKEAEAAIHLRAEVFKFESAEQSLRGEVGFLRDQNTALEREKNELNVKVTNLSASVKVREQEAHELEISSTGLQDKVTAYEGFVSQLEKFQDEKLEEVNKKFDKLCADFVEMALHLKAKFYPHLLTTISGRRWLLTYDMKLAVAKCLNSTKYLSALGAIISKAVEKGMQEGLSAPSKCQLFLIAELKSNKDASVDTIMNLLLLDDVLAERLGLTESQPHVEQLMVPIHHSLDQRVVGASALTFSLEVSNSRGKEDERDIANHVSALRGMFVPLSEPLSATTLEGMEGQGGARVDDETAADDDKNLFVSNADLNISE
uniref:Transposase (Putative), gypsy type n=1 Tax=Tanacetum cinerariifolium TaxID=118510 RepID=A0A6L2JA25_TANCI|nr:hypothetical protein [Tanacetum cinerariifolium]